VTVAARPAARRISSDRIRLAVIGAAMVLAWVVLGARLFEVQVVRADEYSASGLDQRLVEQELSPTRGPIYDRNGDPVALTIDGQTIYAVPNERDDILLATQQVASLSGFSADDMREAIVTALAEDRNFVYLARQLEPDVAARISALEIPGVYSITEAKRVYPAGTVAAQAVGLVDIDGNGQEGLELVYDELLRGTPGSLRYERALRSSAGVIPQAVHELVPPVPGEALTTTLDLPLQYATIQACLDAVERTAADSCWAVAIQPETGEILAIAGVPEFDPELRARHDGGGFTNAVVRDQYEPGSTQKLITVAAALDTNAVDINTVIPQVGDSIEINQGACRSPDDDIPGCYGDASEHETRDMTVKEIFTISSNVGTIKVASRLEEGALEEYMDRFGFGQATGIDFNGEAAGLITIPAGCSTCLPSAAIGYSVAVTPLQLAAAYAAVANDGVWIQPHLVSAQADVNGNTLGFEPESRRVVSENTAHAMRQLLGMVVEEGTGTAAQIEGYRVGGKTGTASKLTEDGYSDDENIASFVGMAPVDDPQVVVAVVVDNPAFEFRFGGLAAAPVFSEVMQAALQRLEVAPDAVARY
jgi:cell division protein FtsI (penicillin-binding protein 3)